MQFDAMTTMARWGKGRNKNWRDAPDIYSFYFTRFPEDIGEKDLWFKFKKWGDVREVFIARNRNKSGWRYGFVRFKRVNNAWKLKRQLNNLVLGGLKLHVNLPKHGREWKPTERVNKEHQHKEEVVIEKLPVRDKGKGKEIAEHMSLARGLQK
ncbi:hypothetical protein AAZX31_19G124900 [Glycine max]